MTDYHVPTEHLWDLVEQWRELARDREAPMPFLSSSPRVALAQGLNMAAENLANLLLELDL